MFTEVDEFVEAVNITIGNLDIVRETQIDSQATVYADDSGFLEPVCSETCDPEADGSESHSFEPPLKKQKVKPLQASLSKSQALTNNFQDDILKSIRGKTLTGIHQIMLSRIEGPDTPFRDTNISFVKQVQDGQTAACTLPQPLALHLIGENDKQNVDKEHLNGYSYICLGGNHQRLAAVENHSLYPHMVQYMTLPSNIFVNLTQEEEIFVATNHNIIGHNINRVSHKDMVKLFRSLKPSDIDVESARCENTKEWRMRCQQHLPLGSDISSYQSIFWISCASDPVYTQILLIYDLFEQGKLKNQKLKKHESMMTPCLNVTRPWRALMTLPEETVVQMLTKVTSLEYDLDEMTKEAEYLKGTRNIQYALCKLTKMSWEKTLDTFWSTEEEAEEELSQFIGDVKRGVPGERLRQFVERKLKDPSSRAKPLVFQDHPLNFIKGGSLNNPVDVILFNEEISEWQTLLRVCMELPLLNEEHTIVLTTSWASVSDTKKGVELMYPNKATLVVVLFNRRSNYTQPFLCITSSKTGIKGLSALIEGNTKSAFYEKLLLQVSPKNGNLVVLHCGKGEALQAGVKKGLTVIGVDTRNEMVRSCNRALY